MRNDQTLKTIEFVITGLDGITHSFSLLPMKQKTAQNIMHNILLTVLETVAGVLQQDITDEEAAIGIMKGLKTLDYDSFWFIAERVLKYASVDGGTDVQNLGDATWYRKDPLLIYRAVYEGVKGNYPDVFQALDLEDLFRKGDPEKSDAEKTGTDTPEVK